MVRSMVRRELGLGCVAHDLPRGGQHRDPDLPRGMDLAADARPAAHIPTRLHHRDRIARRRDRVHQHPPTPYRPSFWHLLGAAAAVAFLAWAAKKYAGPLWARLPARRLPRSPRAYALAGFGFLMGSFLLYGGGPSFGIIPSITILEGAAVLAAVMLLVRRTSDDPARWARQRFAFVAGAMGFLIVLAAFLEIAGWRGMAIVGAAFAFLLVRLYRK